MLEINTLSQYFAAYGDHYMCVWTKKPVGSASERYGFFKDMIEGEESTNLEIIDFSFDPSDKSCEFVVDTTKYRICIAVEPTDKFGSTCTNEEVYLVNDCLKIYFADQSCFEFDSDLIDAWEEYAEQNDFDVYEYGYNFENWLQSNLDQYDFISEVTCPDIACGTDSSISFGTTNKLFDSEEWKGLFSDFRTYCES